MKSIFLNWKTSSAGLVLIATGVVAMISTKAFSVESLTAILGGIGLLFGADATAK